MKAYTTHQPFHVRRRFGSDGDLDLTAGGGKLTGDQPRKGSTYPPQNSPVVLLDELDEDALVGGRARTSTGPGAEEMTGPRMELQWMVSQAGKLPGMIRTPRDLCFMTDKSLLVAEERNSRVQVLSTRTGKSKACVDRGVAPGLGGPTALSLSAQGEYFMVADTSQVHYFNHHGKQEMVWPGDTVTGSNSSTSGRGSEFQRIMGMSADCFDNIVVADSCAKRGPMVGVYAQDTGQSIRQCRLKSGEVLREPSAVACNKRLGLTYVSDSIIGSVYGFDKHAKHVFTFGTPGKQKGNGGLVCPLGLSIGPEDEVYVADKGSGSVTVYGMLGGEAPLYKALSPEDGLRDPVAVSVGPNGELAVAEETFDFGRDSFSVKLFRKVNDDQTLEEKDNR